MPISKNGNTYYTKEQYFRAKHENNNALEYAQKQGYPLIKAGGYYHLAEHDSMIFTPNGQWYWNSRGLQGGALDFMVAYEGKNFADAVCELAGNEPTAILSAALNVALVGSFRIHASGIGSGNVTIKITIDKYGVVYFLSALSSKDTFVQCILADHMQHDPLGQMPCPTEIAE